jgi:hypothetical protein
MKTDLTIWTIKKYLKFYSVCLLLLLLTPLFTQSKNLTIESLASKCPYLDGQAVFKARTLYAMIAGPLTYNDLAICNNLGVYKGGVNWYELENAGLFNQPQVNDGLLQVFPNPGSDLVTFRLSGSNSELKSIRIFNITGQIVLEDNISNQTGLRRLDIKNLPLGMYSYQCISTNGLAYSGKLIKN